MTVTSSAVVTVPYPATAWVMVAVSSSPLSSWAAVTVTVCAVSQSWSVKVNVAGSAVTSVTSVGSVMATVTVPVGSVSRTTV